MTDKEQKPKQKIGEGMMGAMARQGLSELRAAIFPASNIAQPADFGMYGVKTQGEIAQARRAPEPDMEIERE